MHTIYQIRIHNSRLLIEHAGSMAEFANQIERSQTQVSRFAGKNPTRNIGEKLARHIERSFCLTNYWLDQDRMTEGNAVPEIDPEVTKHQELHAALKLILQATDNQKIDEVSYHQLLEIAKKILPKNK